MLTTTLTANERNELAAYAAFHGLTWKTALCLRWEMGNNIMRSIFRKLGPSPSGRVYVVNLGRLSRANGIV